MATAVPAQLGFLAIYNPSLSHSDESMEDQIVYYASSSSTRARRRRHHRGASTSRSRPTENLSPDERNERLRQIGLAQGVVSFGSSFAAGQPVDTIDTEKARIVLHELEPGWWILASIDFTRVPLPPKLPTSKSTEPQAPIVEYSARELKSAALLRRDLLRAHSIFLLHHGPSFAALFARTRRSRFVAMLGRYWDLFLSSWSVSLRGNPARDIFYGINVAASGELGIGVGEEDRGSGEREVLEGLVGRVDGLVDVVVSKFGSTGPGVPGKSSVGEETGGEGSTPWLGSGLEPEAEDGTIFLGVGALSRQSLQRVTHWMEDLYTWGDHAYGVIEDPASTQQQKNERRTASKQSQQQQGPPPSQPTTPPPALKATHDAPSTGLAVITEASDEQTSTMEVPQRSSPKLEPEPEPQPEEGAMDKFVGYLKLGYGTYWTLPGSESAGVDSVTTADDKSSGSRNKDLPLRKQRSASSSAKTAPRKQIDSAEGHYLIGLRGQVEESIEQSGSESEAEGDNPASVEHSQRTHGRTIFVELQDHSRPSSPSQQGRIIQGVTDAAEDTSTKTTKLRAVVYVNKPFLFAFLFRPHPSLSDESLYRSLHYQLAPLRQPLLTSTTYRGPEGATRLPGLYNLVWDPESSVVHSTVPNIPDVPRTADWSRLEALATHMHILAVHENTRPTGAMMNGGDGEQTVKTNRGWWIVWTRIVPAPALPVTPTRRLSDSSQGSRSAKSSWDGDGAAGAKIQMVQGPGKEIILLRRASDQRGSSIGSAAGFSRGRAQSDLLSVARLSQGIGVDSRRYIEELLGRL